MKIKILLFTFATLGFSYQNLYATHSRVKDNVHIQANSSAEPAHDSKYVKVCEFNSNEEAASASIPFSWPVKNAPYCFELERLTNTKGEKRFLIKEIFKYGNILKNVLIKTKDAEQEYESDIELGVEFKTHFEEILIKSFGKNFNLYKLIHDNGKYLQINIERDTYLKELQGHKKISFEVFVNHPELNQEIMQGYKYIYFHEVKETNYTSVEFIKNFIFVSEKNPF